MPGLFADSRVTFATDPTWWVLLALGLAVIAITCAAYWRVPLPLQTPRRFLLGGLRLTAFACVTLAALRPVVTNPAQSVDVVVPILVDTSRSMGIRGGNQELPLDARRLDEARALVLERIMPQFVDTPPSSRDVTFAVDVLTFGDEVVLLSVASDLRGVDPGGRRTHLGGALSRVQERYARSPIAGVILLSDGSDSSGIDPRVAARGLDAPVFAFAVGSDPALDVAVTSVVSGTAVVAGSLVDIDVSVVARGRGEDVEEVMDVRLLTDGQLVDVRRVTTPGDDVAVSVRFQVVPEPDAATVYSVEIPAASGELLVENNRRDVVVPPPGRPRRLLMVEGAPGFDHSFLKRVWLADPGIELDAVVRKGQNDLGQHTFYIQADGGRGEALRTGFPQERSELFQYDGVVFANIESAAFRPDQLAMTADFVEVRGGGLLLTGSASLTGPGLQGSPLETALPVELSSRGRSVGDRQALAWLDRSSAVAARREPDLPMLTEDGRHHAVTQLGASPQETDERWAELPRLGGSVALGPARPGASVLAVIAAPGGDVRPLLAVQRFGRGRTMVFTGESAWRWQMNLPSDDRTYERVWGQAARWLTADASDPLSVTVADGVVVGERVEIEIKAHDDEFRSLSGLRPLIRIQDPNGRATTERGSPSGSGGYTAGFVAESAGLYRVETTVATPTAGTQTATDWVLAGGFDPELSDSRVDADLLQRVAQASGGRLLSSDDIQELPALLRQSVANRGGFSSPVQRELWHGVWPFLLVVAVLIAEWSLRRAWGMR